MSAEISKALILNEQKRCRSLLEDLYDIVDEAAGDELATVYDLIDQYEAELSRWEVC